MSAIREENIGFGGTDSNIQPYPPKDSINLDPLLEEARKLRSASKVKEVHQDVLKHTISQKNIDDTKRMLTEVNEKMSNYPKHHLSYEGSMVVCVLLSMQEFVDVPLNSLPQIDQKLIRSIVPDNYKNITYICVNFDGQHDFVVSLTHQDEKICPFRFFLFNAVAHPREEDLKDTVKGIVEIEDDENTINLGGTIKYDKKRLANLAGTSQPQRRVPEPEPSSILKTTNRNAYEIRADVLQMAIDWSKSGQVPRTDEQLLELAKKFYTFVENRR